MRAEPVVTEPLAPPPRLGRQTFAVTAKLRDGGPAPSGSPATIAVIGGGFSGTLLALHLLRRCPGARVLLIERNPQFGRGLAYATGNDNHLLNVTAGKMSAFRDEPRHFLDWLAVSGHGAAYDADSFVPRHLFGAYVRHLLNSELKSGDAARLELLRGEVVDVEDGKQLTLTLDRGRRIGAHLAVIAAGNFAPEPPPVADPWVYESRWFRGDPWAEDTMAELDPASAVLLIGTGLTMIDTVMSLLDRGHAGPLYAISRRGLLPRHHARRPMAPELTAATLPTTITALTRLVRREIAAAGGHHGSWQSVIDALRPMTQGLWQALPSVERARFLRHLRPMWDVHRHRIPPAIATRVTNLLRHGQLTIAAGRITAYDPDATGIAVEYRARRQGELRRVEGIARIINCSGPAGDFDRVRNPLIGNLLARGKARPDEFRLGLDVTREGALKARDGAISQRLFAVGPLTKGVFWEMTAVPDIRRQGELLAAHLGDLVAGRRFPALAEANLAASLRGAQ